MTSAQLQTALREPAPATEDGVGPFVVNLCSSTTPMALSHPNAPELKRFTFFMSRRREDGRERFRLHMGYFATMAEAEEWLGLVREIYPGAWVGEAPGKRLKPAQKSPAVAAAEAAVIAAPAEQTVAAPSAVAPASVPTVHPAPLVAAEAAKRRSGSRPKRSKRTPFEESNVREVLAQLDEVDEPSKAATRQASTGKAAEPALPAVAQTTEATLTESQVLAILESSAPPSPAKAPAPAAFAVQLQWAVQPIDLQSVPPLAILDAYKLYTIEGSREGRRWYGLRLGFFKDASSAKQVAQYVRSEFATVAVVPVSAREQARALESDAPSTQVTSSPQRPWDMSDEFKLIDDVQQPRSEPLPEPEPIRDLDDRTAAPPPEPLQWHAAASARRSKIQTRRAPQSLEETLEILGAGDLQIDKGKEVFVKESAARRGRGAAQTQKSSPFSRLLERLAERAGKA